MKFRDVDSALKYAYGVDCWSHYGENILTQWMDTQRNGRPSTGLTKLDHITVAGKVMQLTRRNLSEHLLSVVNAFYVVPGEGAPQDADRHRTTLKMQSCRQLALWCEVDADHGYLFEQVKRWADLEPQYSQKHWAETLGVSTGSLATKNRQLKRWLNDELSRAWLALEIPFCERGVLFDETD